MNFFLHKCGKKQENTKIHIYFLIWKKLQVTDRRTNRHTCTICGPDNLDHKSKSCRLLKSLPLLWNGLMYHDAGCMDNVHICRIMIHEIIYSSRNEGRYANSVQCLLDTEHWTMLAYLPSFLEEHIIFINLDRVRWWLEISDCLLIDWNFPVTVMSRASKMLNVNGP